MPKTGTFNASKSTKLPLCSLAGRPILPTLYFVSLCAIISSRAPSASSLLTSSFRVSTSIPKALAILLYSLSETSLCPISILWYTDKVISAFSATSIRVRDLSFLIYLNAAPKTFSPLLLLISCLRSCSFFHAMTTSCCEFCSLTYKSCKEQSKTSATKISCSWLSLLYPFSILEMAERLMPSLSAKSCMETPRILRLILIWLGNTISSIALYLI